MAICSVIPKGCPVLRLWISDARRAELTLAGKIRSLRLDAALYALIYDQSSNQGPEIPCSVPLLVLLVLFLCLENLCR